MRIRMLSRILLSLMAGGLVVNANAIGNGFYMGLQMGSATNKSAEIQAQGISTGNQPVFVTAKPRTTQFGTRIFMGNQFSRFAAIEGGGLFFSTINYSTTGDTCGGTDQRLRGFDLVGKGILPFGDWFDVYGKAGVALLYLTRSGGLNPNFKPTATPPVLCGSNSYKNKVAPTFSIGASYDINQSWLADISLDTIQVSANDISSVSMIAIGISYHFTFKYCGQFLCDD